MKENIRRYISNVIFTAPHLYRYAANFTVDNIKDGINFFMPPVANETLLLFYHSIVVKENFKFLFGSGDPAQKMFVLLSETCGEFQELQKRACMKSQRKTSTATILKNLQDIVALINDGVIPDVQAGESILWFEYGGEIYTVYDLCVSLITQYVEYQISIDSFYESTPPPQELHHTTRPSNGGHYGGARSPRERSPAKIKLMSLQEIEGMNLALMNLEQSIEVFQDYVKNTKLEDLKDEELRFMGYANKVNQEIHRLQDDARRRYNRFYTTTDPHYDPLGETDKIRIYTRMQESLQAMATLISDDEAHVRKTYQYGRQTYEMSKVINTLMHDAASEIFRLGSRYDTHSAPQVPKASMKSMLLRIQSICI